MVAYVWRKASLITGLELGYTRRMVIYSHRPIIHIGNDLHDSYITVTTRSDYNLRSD